ncbi:MAG: ADOP family duplicated permease [Thermoanaerobaculia bacterium]
MRRIAAVAARVRDLFCKDRLEAELDEELAFHLERETEENLRRGLTPAAARSAARRSLGMPERVKEDCRREHGLPRLESLGGDLRFALRGLRRQPGFAAAAVLTLALGTGADTAVFSVVRGVLLRPLPFPEPDRLVQLLGVHRRDGMDQGTISYPNAVDVSRLVDSFESVAVYDEWEVLVRWDEGARKLQGASVSASYFETLGVAPAAGRFFRAEENEPGSASVVVLSYGLWQRRFGGEPGVVGRTLELDGRGYRVVGVAPRSLEDPRLSHDGAPELWRSPPRYFATAISRSGRSLTAIARLRPGVAVDRADAELETVMRGLEEAYPEDNARRTMVAVPLEESIVGDVRRPLWLLLAAAGLVLLVACANLANLLLARSELRAGEIAVRAMVGASRGRILRQLVVEGLVLSLLGGTLGVLFAAGSLHALGAAGAQRLPRWSEVRLDPAVLAFALGLAALTALVFALVPGLRLARTDLEAAIDGAHRGATPGAGRSRSRRLLVAGEVALTLVLLVGSGLCLRSLAALHGTDPGFAADRLLSARLTTPPEPYDEPASAAALYDRLLARAEALPGAESAAVVNILPLSGNFDGRAFRIAGRPEPEPGSAPRAELRAVSPGFFRTAGIPVLAGRAFRGRDGPDAPPVAVVDRAAAQRYWPGGGALGRRIDLGDGPVEIVGIAGKVRQFRLDRPADPTLYVSHVQTDLWTWIDAALLVRTAGEPGELREALRSAVREEDPRIAVEEVLPMAAVLGETTARARFRTVLLSAFGTLALALGVIGLYGVVAYATAGRSRELGIRMALGAAPASVLGLVMREGLNPALVGAATGAAASLLLARAFEGLLFGVEPADPATLGGATAALLLAAAVACFLPARRATRVDPVATLRE